ncbi:MAG: isoprenyl transferase [Clostridia bacterium]
MEKKFECLPQHIAIIMDGNGRWAKDQGLNRSRGHKKGAQVFEEICEYASKIGIKHITFYAFSTENWKRSKVEVAAIMTLLRQYLKRMQEQEKDNDKAGYCIKFIGSREGLEKDIVKKMAEVEEKSANKTGIYINVAVNYGGRAEIVNAVQQIAQSVKDGNVEIDDINEQMLSDFMYTKGQPDPDLIIRPSGEFRLSNFLIWQAAYSEFVYDNVLWPDFTSETLDKAIEVYEKRNRRFGGV